MNIIPTFGRIAVRPDEKLDRTEGGIFLPDASKKETTTGTVVAVAHNITDVKPGDRVLYIKFAGEKTLVQGIIILDFNGEVLGKIEEE